jgi:hypothetical protein
LIVKKYNSTLGTFVQQSCNIYFSDAAANFAIDPSGGGQSIAVGTTIAINDIFNDSTSTFLVLERFSTGATIITGNDVTPGPFVSGNQFTISASSSESGTFSTPVTATINGTTVSDFVAAVSAANVPYVSASVNSAGNIVITHSQGGSILLQNVVGTPVTTAGFTDATPFCFPPQSTTNGFVLSNWVTQPDFEYTASDTAPDQDPADGRLWTFRRGDQSTVLLSWIEPFLGV